MRVMLAIIKIVTIVVFGPIVLLTATCGAVVGARAVVSAADTAARTWGREAPETFLVPHDFSGPVLFAYEQRGAPATPREGDAIVYRVPSDGVVVSGEQLPRRRRSIDVYQVGPDGRRTFLYRDEGLRRCRGPASGNEVRVCLEMPHAGPIGPRFDYWYVSRGPVPDSVRVNGIIAAMPRLQEIAGEAEQAWVRAGGAR